MYCCAFLPSLNGRRVVSLVKSMRSSGRTVKLLTGV